MKLNFTVRDNEPVTEVVEGVERKFWYLSVSVEGGKSEEMIFGPSSDNYMFYTENEKLGNFLTKGKKCLVEITEL